MSKYRRAAKIDENQPEIVKQLRSIPGVTVEPNHDDILIGYRGKTYWIELKNPDTIKKSGGFKKGAVKKSQVDLLNTFTGHYAICSTIKEILKEIGVSK